MFVIVPVGGRRVRALYEKHREARCGRCLEKTSQSVSTLEMHSHVMLLEYGRGREVGRVSQCDRCKHTVPIRPRAEGAGKRSSRERWIDAFLDAHVLELSQAEGGTVVGIALLLAAALALAVAAALGMVLRDSVTDAQGTAILLGFLVASAVAIAAAYVRTQRTIGDVLFARAIDGRLARLRAEHEIHPSDLAMRARATGYVRLAEHFDLPRYAPPAAGAQGPYR